MHYLSALAAFVVSLACLWILLSPFGRRLLLDRPNARSLHERPVPRSGGIAIVAGVAAAATTSTVFAHDAVGLMLVIGGALAALSLADDVFTLPTMLRLAAHLAAAGIAVILVLGTGDALQLTVLMLAVAWYANLYNFIDRKSTRLNSSHG